LDRDVVGLCDSKKLSPKRRVELAKEIKSNSRYHIVISSSKRIDEIGLSRAIKESILEIMDILKADRYLFDGNTTYNINGLESLIKADESVAEVSASSILAKTSRDDELLNISHLYPNYNLTKHKGYITKEHIAEIENYGYSEIHRKSYKIKSLQGGLDL
jgi:ribonuclease HII